MNCPSDTPFVVVATNQTFEQAKAMLSTLSSEPALAAVASEVEATTRAIIDTAAHPST